MKQAPSNGRRLILFPMPLQGHINPMLQLANILFSKGFSITIIHTNFNSPNPSNYPRFTFHSLSEKLSDTESSTEDVLALVSLLNTKCVDVFSRKLEELVVSDGSISCLITDALWHFTQAVSDTFKLPRIVIQTGSVFSFLVVAALPVLQEKGYLDMKDSQGEEPIEEFPPLRVKDIPMLETRHLNTFFQMIDLVTQATKQSSAMIFNSCEELEKFPLTRFLHEFQIPTFLIGPFHKYFPASSNSLLEQDRSCIPWLDKQAPKSVVYVSFGSLVMIQETEFLEIAWGLRNSHQPFLWVVRPGSVRGSKWVELLPDGFMENLNGRGKIVKWAPQQEVLGHSAIGVFLTHCGWNSILESVCEGVTMICQPYDGDQKVNARHVSDVWRVGLHLESKIERGEIEKAIRRSMVESEGQEIREAVDALQGKMDLCLKERGSSNQSLDELVNHILSIQFN